MESGSKDWLGRIWVFLLGLALASAGGFFCWWLWAAWHQARAMDNWLEVRAEVVLSEVRAMQFNEFSQREFSPVIRYRYQFSGSAWTSESIRLVPVRSAREEQARKWVERYPQGAVIRAYVDPQNPARAVLRKNSKAALYALWFPGLFILLGVVLSASALRFPRTSGEKDPPVQPRA